jgi:phosphoglycerate dehydrogenase-like enzyme
MGIKWWDPPLSAFQRNHPNKALIWRMFFECADILTVHVPLNDTTRGMFSRNEFAQMKPTAYFINTSRGPVVDEDALLGALRNGWIAGAALDVFCDEPHVNPLLIEYAKTYDNLILTPHLGGNTQESREKTQVHLAQKIIDFLGGGSHAST